MVEDANTFILRRKNTFNQAIFLDTANTEKGIAQRKPKKIRGKKQEMPIKIEYKNTEGPKTPPTNWSKGQFNAKEGLFARTLEFTH